MPRRLAFFVHGLTSPDGGIRSFGPDDEVPGWAAEIITNPSAWADGDGGEPAEPVAEMDGDQVVDEQGGGDAGDKSDGPPPRSGAGSGRDAWVAYAEAHDFEVDPDDGRDEIIAGLAEAGIAVE